MRNIQMATMMPRGMIQPKNRSRRKVESMRPVNSTLYCSSSVTRRWSSTPGMRVTVKARTSSDPRRCRSQSPALPVGAGRASGRAIPRISRSLMATRSTFPARTSSRNFDMGSSTVRGARSQDWRSVRTRTTSRT
jgi:hypothetical protein